MRTEKPINKKKTYWNIIKYLSIKTLIFNFKYFRFKDAIKLPVFISRNVIFRELKGSVIIEGKISTAMIKIGFGEIGIFDYKRSKSIWKVEGRLVFKGKAFIGHGTKITVESFGELIIGYEMHITAETTIVSLNKIEFGNNCLLSWDILIMDDDFHTIVNKETNEHYPQSKPIIIGNDVWIGCRVTILKGTTIPDGSIIGANSLVSKKLTTSNCLYSGNPIKLRKENIEWIY